MPSFSNSEHLNSNNSPFRFNAKELDEATGNYYYGARYYNPKWSTWLSVDPLAEEYPALSPYAYVANNPINLIDPDGRHIDTALLDENDPNYSQEAAEAFLIFAKSKEGQEFLADYASEGQEIAGVTYSQGEYDKEGLDISFRVKELKNDKGEIKTANGDTDVSLNDKRGKIIINLNSKGKNAREYQSGKDNKEAYLYNLVGTITHESFIHADYFAEDFFDGGGFNRSNVKGTISGSPHHYAADRAAQLRKGRFTNQGYNLMKKMNSKFKQFKSDSDVWYNMWDFQY